MHAVERAPRATIGLTAKPRCAGKLVSPRCAAAECRPEGLSACSRGRAGPGGQHPPYVGTGESHVPVAEVSDHDPRLSLGATEDGLDVIRLVERAAARLLQVGGHVVIERPDRQSVSVPALRHETGDWTEVRDHRDHEGPDRFVTARRR